MTNTETEKAPEKPSDRITVTVNGQPQEVFMSGGMIRNLVPFFGGLESMAEIFNEPTLQNEVMIQMLKPRSIRGENPSIYTIDDFELTLADSQKIIGWAAEHVLYYFIESVTTATELGQRNQGQLQTLAKLMESLSGLDSSMAAKQ